MTSKEAMREWETVFTLVNKVKQLDVRIKELYIKSQLPYLPEDVRIAAFKECVETINKRDYYRVHAREGCQHLLAEIEKFKEELK